VKFTSLVKVIESVAVDVTFSESVGSIVGADVAVALVAVVVVRS
jgi:hypothetical protein